MAYANATQVYALNTGRTFTATSRPSIGQVNGFLEETAAVIDSILSEQSYVTPVGTTATGARLVLAHYNAIGAAKMVEDAAPTSDRRKEATEMWLWAQKMLKSGSIEFPDAELNVAHDMPSSSLPATAMFSRDMEF